VVSSWQQASSNTYELIAIGLTYFTSRVIPWD
jgi:hypothetical protein